MKNFLLSLTGISLVVVFLAACNSGDKPNLKTNMDTIAYVVGSNIANNLKENIKRDSIDFSMDALVQGFKDALNGTDSLYFSDNDKQTIMMGFQKQLQQKQAEKVAAMAAPNKEAGRKFLEENKKNQGVIQTASGLQYKVIKEGNGKSPSAADQVTVHYEGKLLDGKIFDSSYERKEPITFAVNGVIPGWTEGLQLMKEGGTYELFIPSDLAYGDQGNQAIPGGSTLVFKVELIKVIPAGQPAADQPKK